jgi:hypothetical protein
MKKHRATFDVRGTVSVDVSADNEDEAEIKAREILDDGWELDDGEIEDCWDITEIKEKE